MVSRLIFAAVIGQNGHAGPLRPGALLIIFRRNPPNTHCWLDMLFGGSADKHPHRSKANPPATGNPRMSLDCQPETLFRGEFRCVRVNCSDEHQLLGNCSKNIFQWVRKEKKEKTKRASRTALPNTDLMAKFSPKNQRLDYCHPRIGSIFHFFCSAK